MSDPTAGGVDEASTSAPELGGHGDTERAHVLLRLLRGALGGALVAGGVVLTVLPGPGLLLILVGLGILSVDYPAAARLRDRVLRHAAASGRHARAAARRILVLLLVVLLVTVVVTAALSALVVGALS